MPALLLVALVDGVCQSQLTDTPAVQAVRHSFKICQLGHDPHPPLEVLHIDDTPLPCHAPPASISNPDRLYLQVAGMQPRLTWSCEAVKMMPL